MKHAESKAAAAARLKVACGGPYDFVKEALTVCSEDRGKVASELRGGTKVGRNFVDAAARPLLSPGGARIWPGTKVAQAAVEAAFNASGGLHVGTTALVLAEMVDDLFADTMRSEFAACGSLTLVDGDLVVAPNPMLKERFEATHGAEPSLGPRPSHLAGMEFEPTALTNSRLMSGLTDSLITVKIDMSRVLELDKALLDLPVAAAVHPLGRTTPFDGGSIVGGGLFGLGPKNEKKAWKATVKRLTEAAAAGVQIAVVPELDLGASIEPDLSGHAVPALVVSGSRHWTDGKSRVNDAVLHLNGEVALTHRKLHAFGAAGEKDAAHQESITCGDTIEVLYSPSWCVAVLICADVNSIAIMGLLTQLRANIVLVPAMSAAIGFFAAHLTTLSADNQALCVVSNHPPNDCGKDTIETSIFAFPAKDDLIRKDKTSNAHVHIQDWSSYKA